MSASKFLRVVAAGKWLVIFFVAAGLCRAATAQQTTATDYEGTYGGVYRANQGFTRVVLVLEALNYNEVAARYVFYPDNSNHNVATGEFLLKGSVDDKTGRLVLVGKEWVDQPRGYVMVDVACELSPDRRSLNGQVYLHEDKSTRWDFRATRWSRQP